MEKALWGKGVVATDFGKNILAMDLFYKMETIIEGRYPSQLVWPVSVVMFRWDLDS